MVLGKKITVKDKDTLDSIIFGSLLEQFAKQNNIEPSAEELDAFIAKTEEKERQSQIKFEQDRKKLVAELKNTILNEQERKEKESQIQTIESILETNREMKEQTRGMEDQQGTLRKIRRKGNLSAGWSGAT